MNVSIFLVLVSLYQPLPEGWFLYNNVGAFTSERACRAVVADLNAKLPAYARLGCATPLRGVPRREFTSPSGPYYHAGPRFVLLCDVSRDPGTCRRYEAKP